MSRKQAIKTNPYKSKKNDIDFPISYFDLRALLFWASVGISKSQSGSYKEAAIRPGDVGIVKSYAEHINFPLPCKPQFGAGQ